MKKIKKIIAGTLLASTIFANPFFVNAEWKHTNIKLHHKPFWLFGSKDKDFTKNTQLCNQGYSFDILDENNNKIDQYIPDACKKEILDNNYDILNEEPTQIGGNDNFEGSDGFMGDLFGDINTDIYNNQIESEREYGIDQNSNQNSDDFLNDLFEGPTEPSSQEEDYFAPSSQEEGTFEGDNNMDGFLEDLFQSKNINNMLKVAKTEKNLKLGAKDLVGTIKKFKNEKLDFELGSINVSLLKSQPGYNSKVTSLLSKVEKEFGIDSIKNDFAKNISNVSYSLSTYMDENNSMETKEVFRDKLINDLKTLKKKYEVLKRKDMIVTRTLSMRGQL